MKELDLFMWPRDATYVHRYNKFDILLFYTLYSSKPKNLKYISIWNRRNRLLNNSVCNNILHIIYRVSPSFSHEVGTEKCGKHPVYSIYLYCIISMCMCVIGQIIYTRRFTMYAYTSRNHSKNNENPVSYTRNNTIQTVDPKLFRLIRLINKYNNTCHVFIRL